MGNAITGTTYTIAEAREMLVRSMSETYGDEIQDDWTEAEWREETAFAESQRNATDAQIMDHVPAVLNAAETADAIQCAFGQRKLIAFAQSRPAKRYEPKLDLGSGMWIIFDHQLNAVMVTEGGSPIELEKGANAENMARVMNARVGWTR